MRIRDWSSDVCASDLDERPAGHHDAAADSGSQDDAEHHGEARGGAVGGFRERKAVGVVHQPHRTAKRGGEVAVERLSEQPGSACVLDQTAGCGKRAGDADADAAAPAGLRLNLLNKTAYGAEGGGVVAARRDRKSTRLNSSH